MTGLIELAVVAILIAWLIGKVRKRFNMKTDRHVYTAIIIVVVLVALALWATHAHG